MFTCPECLTVNAKLDCRACKSTPESRCDGREFILIGVPNLDGTSTMIFAQWMAALQKLSTTNKLPFYIEFVCAAEKRPVEFARNILCGHVLRHPIISRLWMIDADMIPYKNSLEVLNYDQDIVIGRASGIRVSNSDKVPKFMLSSFLKMDTGMFRPVETHRTQPCSVNAGGTASMVIRRHVLEDRRLWGSMTYTGLLGETIEHHGPDHEEYAPPIFHVEYTSNGSAVRGEDMDFGDRATELGYYMTYVPTALIGHIKPLDLTVVEHMVSNAYREGAKAAANGTFVSPVIEAT